MVTGCVSTDVTPVMVPAGMSVPLVTVVFPLRVFEPDSTIVPPVGEIATAVDVLFTTDTVFEMPPEVPDKVKAPPLTVIVPVNVSVAEMELFEVVIRFEPFERIPLPVEIPVPLLAMRVLVLAMSNVPDIVVLGREMEPRLARLALGPKILKTP